MSLWKFLGKVFKALLPFLKSHAEKLVNQLPEDAQYQLASISQMVEAVKQYLLADSTPTFAELEKAAGSNITGVFLNLQVYFSQKGVAVSTIEQALELLKQDINQRDETGVKSLWAELFNIIASEVSEIPWGTLLLGVGQAIWEIFVKGKVKI